VLLDTTWLAFELTLSRFHFSVLRHVKAQRVSSDCESGFTGTIWRWQLEFSAARFRSIISLLFHTHPLFLCFFCTFFIYFKRLLLFVFLFMLSSSLLLLLLLLLLLSNAHCGIDSGMNIES
jgi:hypothetical protein